MNGSQNQYFLYYPLTVGVGPIKVNIGRIEISREWGEVFERVLAAGQNKAVEDARKNGRDLSLYRLEVVTYANNPLKRDFHHNGTNWVEGQPG